MKENNRKLTLASYNDIFGLDESQPSNTHEQIVELPLSELYPFQDHPFQVKDDDRMKETAESVKEYGVLVPAIVRPREDGGYEIVAGHRRKRACELAGLEAMPAIVRNLDDDEAVIIMVDSNLQRENILPSERAKAYKMKLDAIKHRAGRPTVNNFVQLGQNSQQPYNARDQVAKEAHESPTQVQRYLRLNNLQPELMAMVDEHRLAFNPAVELSYLKPEEQQSLIVALETTQATPSLSQAQRMKKLSQEGKAEESTLIQIMSEEKKPLTDSITISHDTLRKYFPKDYSTKKMEAIIMNLLDIWLQKRLRKKEQQQER